MARAPTAPPRATCRSLSPPTRRCCSGACSRRACRARRRSPRRPLAGVSAPLCTACGIEPFAIAAKNAGDPVNFGLGDPTDPTLPTNYTFYFNCTGTAPAFLPNSGQYAPYTIINRYDAASTTVPDETEQLFRIGASGLMSSTTPNPTGSTVPIGCAGIGDPLEAVWNSPVFSAAPPQCTAPFRRVHRPRCAACIRASTTAHSPAACTAAVTDYAALAAAQPSRYRSRCRHRTLYTAYHGNGRRVITVAVVDALAVEYGHADDGARLPPVSAGAQSGRHVLQSRRHQRPLRCDVHRQPDARQAGLRSTTASD